MARLVSPYLSEERGCLVFWYHMRGSSVGTLNVYVNEKKVFEKWGSQGENWKQGFIELHDHVSTKGYRVSEVLYYRAFPLDLVYSLMTFNYFECYNYLSVHVQTKLV